MEVFFKNVNTNFLKPNVNNFRMCQPGNSGPSQRASEGFHFPLSVAKSISSTADDQTAFESVKIQ